MLHRLKFDLKLVLKMFFFFSLITDPNCSGKDCSLKRGVSDVSFQWTDFSTPFAGVVLVGICFWLKWSVCKLSACEISWFSTKFLLWIPGYKLSGWRVVFYCYNCYKETVLKRGKIKAHHGLSFNGFVLKAALPVKWIFELTFTFAIPVSNLYALILICMAAGCRWDVRWVQPTTPSPSSSSPLKCFALFMY